MSIEHAEPNAGENPVERLRNILAPAIEAGRVDPGYLDALETGSVAEYIAGKKPSQDAVFRLQQVEEIYKALRAGAPEESYQPFLSFLNE